MLLNTRQLSQWIADPLGRVNAAPALDDPERFDGLIPDPEPDVEAPPGARVLKVADTLLDGNESRYVHECLSENWISSAGSFVPRLESAFARAVGCRFAIACSSGTAALHLALAATGVGAGDEVLIPAFTMIATASAPRYLDADPVLVDADPRSWNLDPAALADKLTARTRALIVVHTYGQPADMEPILEFARRNRLIVVEDAAEAHGASYRRQPIGSLGDAAAFSLYANKIVTSGEGGMVTTSDPQVAELARELRDHAFSRERIEGIATQPEQPGGVVWMFGITVTPEFRDRPRRAPPPACRARCRDADILRADARAARSRAAFSRSALPGGRVAGADRSVLPSGPALTDDDIDYVAQAIRANRSGIEAIN